MGISPRRYIGAIKKLDEQQQSTHKSKELVDKSTGPVNSISIDLNMNKK